MIKATPTYKLSGYISAILFCCFSATVLAEEPVHTEISEEELLQEKIDSDTETVDTFPEEKTKPVEPPVEQAIEPTPQPPLIDARPELSYEPATIDSTTIEKSEQATEQIIEKAIDPTPQPPLIDSQKASGYEADTSADATADKNTDPATQETSAQPDGTDRSGVEDASQKVTDNKEQDTNWTDLRPYQVDADWVQLKSGEWLRGRIIAMQDYRLEFYLSLIHI